MGLYRIFLRFFNRPWRALLLLSFFPLYSSALGKPCPAGVPVGTFKILVLPVKGGTALPLSSVNIVGPGEKLRYEPLKVPDELRRKGRVSVLIVPAKETSAKSLKVLAAQPVDAPAEWVVPERASAVGVIFGPRGIDEKKVAALVEKHPEIVTKLADYAEQSSRVEAMVQTLSDYETSAPDSKSLQSALQSFSSQYGLQLPTVDSKTASSQQALMLLRALAPAAQINDPISSPGDAVSKAGSVAGPLAASYFGTPVALAIGGAALVESLRASLFPPTDFRSAFAQQAPSDGMNLCTAKSQDSKTRAHVDYLWMSRPPNEDAPTVSLIGDNHLPLGATSTVTLGTATVAQLAGLSRARDWQLVSNGHATAIPVKITPGATSDTLSLDLSKAKLPAGEYQLAAKWDWTPFAVKGKIDLHPLGRMDNVKLTPDSQDSLVSGAGPVKVELTGTDFEFVDSASLVEGTDRSKKALPVSVNLPKGKQQGDQETMETEIDTASLAPGRYSLAVKQVDGATADVAITIHPPNPELAQTPLRVNLGDPQQKLELHGKRLERIRQISSPEAEWELSPVPKTALDLSEREATVKLAPTAHKGDRIDAAVMVADLHKPLEWRGVLSVAGPRPKILGVTKSFTAQSDVELRESEIPAGASASFGLKAQNIDSHPGIELSCKNADDTRRKVVLTAGDKTDSAEFDNAGEGSLFLSVDPGAVGDSGCELTAQLSEPDTGTSAPFSLGKVLRIPRIDQLAMTDEKTGPSSYVATLTGQDLQLVEKVGWSASAGDPVLGIPTPAPGRPQEQTLKISLPWPPPSPKAPLYIWLRGENQGRRTSSRY